MIRVYRYIVKLLHRAIYRKSKKNLIEKARSRLEKTLMRAEFLRLVQRQRKENIALVDIGMNYVYSSKAWDTYFQRPAVPGNNHYETFPEIPEQKPEWMEDHRQTLEEGKHLHGKDWFNGLLFEWDIKPIFSDGGSIGETGDIIGMVMKITQVYESNDE